MPKVFLSFATEDFDFVTKLFSRLKRLQVDVWDYSNRDEEINLGDKIQESLGARIRDSDFFIPVVSSNSVPITKLCIHYEVRFAAENHKKCFPVVIAKRRPPEWSGAFELICDRKYVEMDHEDESAFEEKICGLCGNLKVVYQPDITDHNRLPLYKDLQQEIRARFDEIAKLGERYIYDKLMKLVNQFNLSYSLGQWTKCLDMIKYFLAFNEHELKSSGFYYPLIVKGVCELQLDHIEDAEKTFKAAINNKNADENAFGGLGQVYFKQNQFGMALIYYHEALDRCPSGQETEIVYNILLTATEIIDACDSIADKKLLVEANRIIHNKEYVNKLESGNFNNKERQRVKYLIGLAFFKAGNYKTAYDYFSVLYEKEAFRLEAEPLSADMSPLFKKHGYFLPEGIPVQNCQLDQENAWIISDGESIYFIRKESGSVLVYYKELSLIINFSRLLELLQQQQKAIDILERESACLDNQLLYHYYASLLARVKRISQASAIYDNYLCQPPYNKQFLVEYALLLRHCGKVNAMNEKCKLVIEAGMPADRRECYYHGFAYFLIGKGEQAKAYYEDSLSYGEYYSNVA